MYQQLLEKFMQLNSDLFIEETFISICGFPHYEKVSSNILQFFIDNKREHKFGNLFIESILELVGWDIEIFGNDLVVETEVKTNKGNYIDILITGNEKALCIENKIYAWLYNDLDDYFKFAKTRKEDVKGIVLSINKLIKENRNYEYITYDDLFRKIKEKLGFYLITSNQRYYSLLLDFIINTESLKKGIDMDMQFIEFIKNNEEEVLRMNGKLKDVHDQFRNKVKTVNSIINEIISDPNIRQWPWRDLPGLFDVAVTDVQIGNIKFVIHAEISLVGWRFCIFDRSESLNYNQVAKLIDVVGNMEDNKRFYIKKEYDLLEPESTIAHFVVDLINKIRSKDLTIAST